MTVTVTLRANLHYDAHLNHLLLLQHLLSNDDINQKHKNRKNDNIAMMNST